jgi:predicted transcriptional regulator
MANTPISPFRLEPIMVAMLDKLATKLGTTRTDIVRLAIMDMARRHRIHEDPKPDQGNLF